MKCRITLLSAMLVAGLAVGTAHSQCTDEGGWDSLPPIPVPTAQAVSVVVDGKVYVFGNKNGDSTNNNRAWCYDPRAGTWTELPNMPTGRGMAAAAAVDGVIHVFGGNNCFSNCWLSTHEAFDTRTNTWASDLPPLPHDKPRGLLSAVAVGPKIYVMGGMNSYDPLTYGYNCIWDCESNSWMADGAMMPTPRSHHAAAGLDGKIYLFGGIYRTEHTQERGVDDVDVYDPQSNAWSYGGTMPFMRYRFAAVEQSGKFQIIGGRELLPNGVAGAILRSVLEFDPAQDCWSVVTPLPAPLELHSAAAIGGRTLVFGGTPGDLNDTPTNNVLGATPKRMIGDLNGDGEVGLTDLASLLANFGRMWSRY